MVGAGKIYTVIGMSLGLLIASAAPAGAQGRGDQEFGAAGGPGRQGRGRQAGQGNRRQRLARLQARGVKVSKWSTADGARGALLEGKKGGQMMIGMTADGERFAAARKSPEDPWNLRRPQEGGIDVPDLSGATIEPLPASVTD
jgi:hypothetical protein